MSVTIEFSPQLEKTVREHAARNGQDLTAFVVQAVEEKVAKARTFAEVCAPIADAVAEAGLTDEEFDRFLEEAREEAWQAKQGRK
jgi:hypothetical protein